METVLSKKLQDVLDKTGMTLIEIARNTGISKESLYKWYKGTKPSNSYLYNKLIRYLDDILESIPQMRLKELEANYALMRDAGMNYVPHREVSNTVKISLYKNRRPVPVINGKEDAGAVVGTDNEPELIANRIDAPFLGDVDGVIEVSGNSMEPTFPNGSRVVIAKLNDPGILEWGACYFIVDKNFQGMVKRVYPGQSKHAFNLVSDNADQSKYPPIDREWDQIAAVFKIKACILKV